MYAADPRCVSDVGSLCVCKWPETAGWGERWSLRRRHVSAVSVVRGAGRGGGGGGACRAWACGGVKGMVRSELGEGGSRRALWAY